MHTIKFTGVSFRLPSLVILALYRSLDSREGQNLPPPLFPGRVILRPFPVRVLKVVDTLSSQSDLVLLQ